MDTLINLWFFLFLFFVLFIGAGVIIWIVDIIHAFFERGVRR